MNERVETERIELERIEIERIDPTPEGGRDRAETRSIRRKGTRLTAWLLILMLLICSLPAGAFAAISTGNSKFDAFINEPQYRDGAAWNWDKRPLLVTCNNFGCAAYCTDFIKYCYGQTNLIGKTEYHDVNEIQAGDVVSLGNPSDGTGHWFVVLNRDGDDLLVAEGNYDSSVRIGWNYTISGDGLAEDYRYFRAGYRYVSTLPGAESGWVKRDEGWRYVMEDGSYAASLWIRDAGKWYCMDEDGYMMTGWQNVSGKWYFFNKGGSMLTGWKKYGGKWYFLAKNGAMVTGWRKVDNDWYYFTGGGAMVTGWKKIKGIWYYFAAGAMVTGRKTIGGTVYVFSKDGALVE